MTASRCARGFRSAVPSVVLVSAAWAITFGAVAALLAAELSVMSAGAMEAAIAPLAIQFQQASGHTVTVEYGTAPQLAASLTQERPADVIIAPTVVVDQAVAEGLAVAASRVVDRSHWGGCLRADWRAGARRFVGERVTRCGARRRAHCVHAGIIRAIHRCHARRARRGQPTRIEARAGRGRRDGAGACRGGNVQRSRASALSPRSRPSRARAPRTSRRCRAISRTSPATMERS